MFKKLFGFIMILTVLFTIAACTDAELDEDPMDDDPMQEEPGNIPTVATEADDFDVLVAALVEAGLVTALEAEGPFTVFAPTDQAFSDLLTELAISQADLLALPNLSDILLYHVVAGSYDAQAVIDLAANGPVEVETLLGQMITLEVMDGKVYVNGSEVIQPDVMASNGIIHVIDGVLLPAEELGNIPTVATEADDFDVLVAALVEAGLVTALEAEGPFTVFAPTDQAFSDLLTELAISQADLLALPNLSDILLYHVVAGSYDAQAVIDLAANGPVEVETLLGQMITLEVMDGKVYVNGSEVIQPDVMASNGIIHVIDGVLLPAEEQPAA